MPAVTLLSEGLQYSLGATTLVNILVVPLSGNTDPV